MRLYYTGRMQGFFWGWNGNSSQKIIRTKWRQAPSCKNFKKHYLLLSPKIKIWVDGLKYFLYVEKTREIVEVERIYKSKRIGTENLFGEIEPPLEISGVLSLDQTAYIKGGFVGWKWNDPTIVTLGENNHWRQKTSLSISGELLVNMARIWHSSDRYFIETFVRMDNFSYKSLKNAGREPKDSLYMVEVEKATNEQADKWFSSRSFSWKGGKI